MSNLLDLASIVLTPTAYNNGEALCVKPDDASGDFQFSRNSAATRVNAQGLVENVQILSSNLVQNGSFSEEGVQEVSNGSFSQEGVELVTNGDFATDTDWTKQTGWSISNGKAIANSSNGSIYQPINFIDNKSYKITFDITEYTSGEVACRFNDDETNTFNSVGSHTLYFVSNNSFDYVYFKGLNSFIGSIDNVSVREVGQDWSLIGTATITENQANIVTTSAVTGISQSNILTIGKSYKLSYNIVSNNNGGLKISGNEIPSVVGNNIYYFEASAAALEILRNSGITDISITNISVKEVGQNWTLNDWSVGDSLISSGNTSTLLQQFPIYTSTTSIYKTTFKAKSVNGTSVTLRVYDGANSSGSYETFTITSSDFQDFTFTRQRVGTDAGLSFYNNSGAEIEITNISVIEITDDTNLPRINYEGFSYDGSGNVVPDSGCGSWLFEPQSTNLITQSELFSDASWVKINSSVVSGFASPSGNTNAYKLIASVSNTDHRTRTAPIATAALGTTVTFSIYIKPQEITKIALVDNWTNLSYGVINLTTNSVIEEAQGTTSVTEILNGFRRVSFTYQTANINTLPAVYLLDDAYTSGNPTSYTFASDGTSGVYMWGAMLEQNSFSTSYIPTSGSTVTRNQDVCTNGGSLASINSTEGVLYAEIAALSNNNTNRIISITDGVSVNGVSLYYSSSSNVIRANYYVGGVEQCNLQYILADETDFSKIAFVWKINRFELWVDSIKRAEDLSGAVNVANTMNDLSFRRLGSNIFFGKTKAVAVWKEALSDAELTELTTI